MLGGGTEAPPSPLARDAAAESRDAAARDARLDSDDDDDDALRTTLSTGIRLGSLPGAAREYVRVCVFVNTKLVVKRI